MGAPAQQPVYYDQQTGQYYTTNNQQNTVATSGDGQVINNPYVNSQSGAGTIFGNMFGNMFASSGMPDSINPFYATDYANRNYLGSPYSYANTYTTNAKATPYTQLTNLFPELNAVLSQGLISSTQSDGAMSGANRFLAPQTTNTQGT